MKAFPNFSIMFNRYFLSTYIKYYKLYNFNVSIIIDFYIFRCFVLYLLIFPLL